MRGILLAGFMLAASLGGVRFPPALAVGRFVPPIDSPGLTSSFGELRDGRFHAGIDYSTESAVGRPVRAVADGWVWRVRASGLGYGRSIYFQLDEGRVAVYAHLSRFAPALEEFVGARQDSSGEYEQDLFPPERRFRFRAGDTIAWSGESGAGPPHLHFELRRGDMNLNPLRHGFSVPDKTPPALAAAWLVPAGSRARVAGGYDPVKVALRAGEAAAAPVVQGPFRLMVDTWDRVDGRPNRIATYNLSASLDGKPAFEAELDSVSWDYMTEAEVVFDYAAASDGHSDRRPLQLLPTYRAGIVRRGASVWSLTPGEHRIEIVARDEAGNRTTSTLRVTIAKPGDSVAPASTSRLLAQARLNQPAAMARESTVYVAFEAKDPSTGFHRPLPQGVSLVDSLDSAKGRVLALSVGELSSNRRHRVIVTQAFPNPESLAFKPGRMLAVETIRAAGDVDSAGGYNALAVNAWWTFPPGAAFERQVLLLKGVEIDPNTLGPELTSPSSPRISMITGVRIDPEDLVLREPARVRWPTVHRSGGSGVGLFVRHGGGWSLIAGDPDTAGTFTGTTRRMGTFAVLRDTIPPRIVPPRRYSSGAIVARVEDGGAGLSVHDQKMFVDNRRVPAEYDPESQRLTWRPRAPLSPGSHRVRVETEDRLGNRASTEVSLEVR